MIVFKQFLWTLPQSAIGQLNRQSRPKLTSLVETLFADAFINIFSISLNIFFSFGKSQKYYNGFYTFAIAYISYVEHNFFFWRILPTKQLTVPIDFHSLFSLPWMPMGTVNCLNILQIIFYCVQQKKEMEWHEGE